MPLHHIPFLATDARCCRMASPYITFTTAPQAMPALPAALQTIRQHTDTDGADAKKTKVMNPFHHGGH